MRTPRVDLLAVLSLALFACGGTATKHPDLGTADLSATPDLTAVVCDYPSLTGVAPATVEEGADMAPAFTGGTIADGTYTLTGLVVFAPSNDKDSGTGLTTSGVLTISGTSIAVNTTAATGPYAGTFQTANSGLALNLDCPKVALTTMSYTATTTTITLGPDIEPAFYETYTKQ